MQANVVSPQAWLVDFFVDAVLFGDHFAEARGVNGVQAQRQAQRVVESAETLGRLHQVKALGAMNDARFSLGGMFGNALEAVEHFVFAARARMRLT